MIHTIAFCTRKQTCKKDNFILHPYHNKGANHNGEKSYRKAGVVVVGVLVAVVAACSAMYAFVPAFYDGVNGILTSITGTQVGIPPVTTTKQTITSQQAASALGEDALSGIDLSGDVTIDFYAKIHTADGQEYEVPLSSADLANGTIQSLLEASGSGSTTNTAQ